jgi:hypothetical protein
MRRFALAALIMMASSTSVHAQFYERPKYTSATVKSDSCWII